MLTKMDHYRIETVFRSLATASLVISAAASAINLNWTVLTLTITVALLVTLDILVSSSSGKIAAAMANEKERDYRINRSILDHSERVMDEFLGLGGKAEKYRRMSELFENELRKVDPDNPIFTGKNGE